MKRFAALLIAFIIIFGTGAAAMADDAIIDASDGAYTMEIEVTGDLGSASIKNPCDVSIYGGKVKAVIDWSNSAVQYMYMNGEKLHRINTVSGYTTFEIAVPVLDEAFEFSAELNDKGAPRIVDCTIRFDSSTLKKSGGNLIRNIIILVIVVAIIVVLLSIYAMIKKRKVGRE